MCVTNEERTNRNKKIKKTMNKNRDRLYFIFIFFLLFSLFFFCSVYILFLLLPVSCCCWVFIFLFLDSREFISPSYLLPLHKPIFKTQKVSVTSCQLNFRNNKRPIRKMKRCEKPTTMRCEEEKTHSVRFCTLYEYTARSTHKNRDSNLNLTNQRRSLFH